MAGKTKEKANHQRKIVARWTHTSRLRGGYYRGLGWTVNGRSVVLDICALLSAARLEA